MNETRENAGKVFFSKSSIWRFIANFKIKTPLFIHEINV